MTEILCGQKIFKHQRLANAATGHNFKPGNRVGKQERRNNFTVVKVAIDVRFVLVSIIVGVCKRENNSCTNFKQKEKTELLFAYFCNIEETPSEDEPQKKDEVGNVKYDMNKCNHEQKSAYQVLIL